MADIIVRQVTRNIQVHVVGRRGPQGIQGIQGIPGDALVTSVNGEIGAVVLDKSDIGLGNVDNTSDANKPVSAAQTTAIGVVQTDIDTHEARSDNPHSVTKTQVGLSNVDNTSDVSKPISSATQAALDAIEAGDVDSVNGATGVVVLDQDDIGDGTTYKQYSQTEKTKLAGIATGATANASDAQLRDRSTHTGTQSADTLTDGTTNKAFLATERTKLSGIATGATANSSDATLLARANHTGTQLAATISDFSTAADARVAAAASTGTGSLVRSSSPLITTPTGIVKGDVGLGNVDNTSDASKPVSSATQTALDAKQPLDSDLTTIAGLTATTDNFMVATASAWASRTPTQARTQLGLGALATLASVGTSQIDDASITLAKMANLAQDQFIGRTTASTGVPQTATITSAARTVLDDATVSAMVDTLGGASATGSGGLVRATSPTLVTPALGTPSSGTLTNATGLPVAGITASTSTALGVGSIELGHATDTTITRVSAGKIAVEGIEVSTATSTLTLTNKRITPRVSTTASSATPTPNADTDDHYTITALAAGATFGAPTGTPTDGQNLTIRIKDNGTARTLAWNAIYRPITITMPTTTVISKTMYLGMKFNSADTRWDVLAYSLEA